MKGSLVQSDVPMLPALEGPDNPRHGSQLSTRDQTSPHFTRVFRSTVGLNDSKEMTRFKIGTVLLCTVL